MPIYLDNAATTPVCPEAARAAYEAMTEGYGNPSSGYAIGQAAAVEDILARSGYEDIKTTADTQGIWRVVEGTANN